MELLDRLKKKKNNILNDLNEREFKKYLKDDNNLKDLTNGDKEDYKQLKTFIADNKTFNAYIKEIYSVDKDDGRPIYDKKFQSYNRGIQYETTAPGQRFQADLADMTFLKKKKIPLRRYNFVLVICDMFSTKVWYIAVTKKNKDVMARSFERFFSDLRDKYNIKDHIWLHVDKGGEFYNSKVKEVLMNKNITLYSTKGKAFLAEQRIFLLKKYYRDKMITEKKDFLKKRNSRHENWWTLLERIQNKVNRLKSSRLRETPENLWNNGSRSDKNLFNKNKTVTKALKKEYTNNLIKKTQVKTNKPGINFNTEIDDSVNIKNIERSDENKNNRFTKQTTNTDGDWSKTKYIIANILKNNTNIGPPLLYQLKDESGEILEGLFTREDFYNNSNKDRITTKREKNILMEQYG